ncbi:hypothetical protein NS274_23775 [Pseudomonas oryzihabitans]|nr:hypothetical protein NS274_23775 [Pseudomonas psychrotolerans]
MKEQSLNGEAGQSDSIYQYFRALHRLVEGKPIRVEVGTKITMASVSLEAGKSAGSIKKQRPIYAELIKEIKRHSLAQEGEKKSNKKMVEIVRRWRNEAENWKKLYHQSLAREVMLLHQLDEVERRLLNKNE